MLLAGLACLGAPDHLARWHALQPSIRPGGRNAIDVKLFGQEVEGETLGNYLRFVVHQASASDVAACTNCFRTEDERVRYYLSGQADNRTRTKRSTVQLATSKLKCRDDSTRQNMLFAHPCIDRSFLYTFGCEAEVRDAQSACVKEDLNERTGVTLNDLCRRYYRQLRTLTAQAVGADGADGIEAGIEAGNKCSKVVVMLGDRSMGHDVVGRATAETHLAALPTVEAAQSTPPRAGPRRQLLFTRDPEVLHPTLVKTRVADAPYGILMPLNFDRMYEIFYQPLPPAVLVPFSQRRDALSWRGVDSNPKEESRADVGQIGLRRAYVEKLRGRKADGIDVDFVVRGRTTVGDELSIEYMMGDKYLCAPPAPRNRRRAGTAAVGPCAASPLPPHCCRRLAAASSRLGLAPSASQALAPGARHRQRPQVEAGERLGRAHATADRRGLADGAVAAAWRSLRRGRLA